MTPSPMRPFLKVLTKFVVIGRGLIGAENFQNSIELEVSSALLVTFKVKSFVHYLYVVVAW